jgi:hypothetical protein
VGEHLWARCTRRDVTLYRGDERLWTHARVARGKRSTVEAHLPEGRRDLRARSAEHWLERAKAIGPETLLLVEEVFASDDVLLKLRAVQAIVTHLAKHPRDRAEAAARLDPGDYLAVEIAERPEGSTRRRRRCRDLHEEIGYRTRAHGPARSVASAWLLVSSYSWGWTSVRVART